ncbi:hypothetical protein CLOHYLEM_05193 [[Clostridium] hylemonae DSM 15053]|uniref:Uncharacterized protein n=1 Tax=[Clostridium] hylemonae DSM 15053 TaxID=553973 RepID=C0BZF4_9FIRM|nr:hypothetical protein CLOHYLEM_05193 [[Clostridium] hylemonae DSM 15053]
MSLFLLKIPNLIHYLIFQKKSQDFNNVLTKVFCFYHSFISELLYVLCI